jgi:hypothetical protein
MSHSHSHDHGVSHSHDDPFNGHGHSHEILDGPGSYLEREMPLIEGRDWKDRAFTIGIGGYVSFFHFFSVYATLYTNANCLQTSRIRQDGAHARAVPCPAR